MRLCPRIPALICLILSLLHPGGTENQHDPDMAADTPVKNSKHKSNSTLIMESISIPDLTSKTIKKNIIISSPGHVKLDCELLSDSKDLLISDVTWEHENEKISSDQYTYNNTGHKCHTSYEFIVTDRSKTGTYSCIFNATTEARAEFHINVPAVKSEDKPLVRYNRDSVVMKCGSSTFSPVEWIWYKVNGSEKVQLNVSLTPNKYDIEQKRANETKLHISELYDGDSGIYKCKAIFKIGESEGQVQLSVLSYMVPLKVFFAIAAEVVVLVAVILIYEMQTKKKQSQSDDKNEVEQMENPKSEDSSTQETNTTRQRKV